MSETTKPNLFDYATKELSQDAMICWLIHWADNRFADTDSELHDCGRRFVQALLCKHGVEPLSEIKTIIYQQEKSIDVLARVSPDHVLLIEDKTGTSDHGDQLRRYYDHVINGDTQLGNVVKDNVYPIFLKTGNQSRSKDRKIEKNPKNFYKRPYKVFSRNDFLAVLCEYKGNHHALWDFRTYLQDWENETNSCCEVSFPKWNWVRYEGFYMELEKRMVQKDQRLAEEDRWHCRGWKYVSNPAGGLLCFSFAWTEITDRQQQFWMFFQIEGYPDKNTTRLTLRLGDWKGPGIKSPLMREVFKRLTKSAGAPDGLGIKKAGRFGGGASGAVAEFTFGDEKNGYLALDDRDIVDLETTMERLDRVRKFVADIYPVA